MLEKVAERCEPVLETAGKLMFISLIITACLSKTQGVPEKVLELSQAATLLTSGTIIGLIVAFALAIYAWMAKEILAACWKKLRAL